MKNALFFILLFTNVHFAFGLNEALDSMAKHQDSKWELGKDKDNIKVYTRNQEDASIKEFIAKTVISSSIEKVFEVMDRPDNYSTWMAHCEVSTTKKIINDSTRIVHTQVSVPWPMDDRELVYKMQVEKKPDKSFKVITTAITGIVPKNDDYVRITLSEGTWSFKETSPEKVEATYQLFADPGGSVPDWIVNMFIVEAPYETLLNLRKLCEE